MRSLLGILCLSSLTLTRTPILAEFAKELLEAGKYEGDERVGYSRSFVLMPQWAEGESSEEEWDESEEESEMTIDGSQSLEVS